MQPGFILDMFVWKSKYDAPAAMAKALGGMTGK